MSFESFRPFAAELPWLGQLHVVEADGSLGGEMSAKLSDRAPWILAELEKAAGKRPAAESAGHKTTR